MGRNTCRVISSKKKLRIFGKRRTIESNNGTMSHTSKKPEWDGNTNDNPYRLTLEEMEHRRRQMVSKNLVKAQVELYEQVKKEEDLSNTPSLETEMKREIQLMKQTMSRECLMDLEQLLRHSEELLKESHELLTPVVPEQKLAAINFTKAEAGFISCEISKDDFGSSTEDEYLSQDHSKFLDNLDPKVYNIEALTPKFNPLEKIEELLNCSLSEDDLC